MLGPWQIAIIVLLILVLFGGRGKITSIMGDLAGGLKAFKKGMSDEDKAASNGEATSSKLTDGASDEVTVTEKPRDEVKS